MGQAFRAVPPGVRRGTREVLNKPGPGRTVKAYVDELIVSKVLSKLDSMHEALGDAVGGLGSDLRGTSEDDALSALWESL